TAQEMIEALDAFAVRAKLTGSNTAMGRFMTQLFGSKKEPWVESSAPGTERTEVSGESDATDDGQDEDNEKTAVVAEEERPRPSSPRIPNPSAGRQSAQMSAQSPDVATWQETETRRDTPGRIARSPSLPFEPRTPPGGSDKMAATLAGTGMGR